MTAAVFSAAERRAIAGFMRAHDVDGLLVWLQEGGWADPRMVRAMLAAAGGQLLVSPANYTDIRQVLVIEPRPSIGAGAIALKIREEHP